MLRLVAQHDNSSNYVRQTTIYLNVRQNYTKNAFPTKQVDAGRLGSYNLVAFLSFRLKRLLQNDCVRQKD